MKKSYFHSPPVRECDNNKIPGQCEGTWYHSLAASSSGGGMCAFLHLRDTVGKGQHSTAPQFQNLGKQKHFCTSYCHVCLLWGHSALRNPGMWPCIPIAQTDLVAKWTSLPLISTPSCSPLRVLYLRTGTHLVVLS